MAIEEFGESLLSDKRKRAEKQAKREKRETLILGAAKIGLDLYGYSLKKKAEKFASNQELWSNRVKYNNTLGVAKTLLKDTEPMDTYIGGERGWVLDNLANPLITKQLATLVPEEQYGKDSLGSFTAIEAERVVDGYTDEQGNEVEGILAKLQKARSAARNLRSIEDYDAMVELNNNNPKSIAEAVMNRFKGKDADSLQQEAINNIKNNKFSTDAEAANVLMQAFYNGASVKDSERLAERFQQAIEEGTVKEKATVQSKKGARIYSAIQGAEIDVIEVTSTDAKGNTEISYESVEGGLPLKRFFEEEETVVDIFKVKTTRKVYVMRNLITGEKVASTPDSTTEQTDAYPDNSVALLNLNKEYVANVKSNVSLVTSDIILDGTAGNEILSAFTADAGDPEAAAKNIVDQIALAGANLTTVTDEAITLTTAGTISMAIAVNEANRANRANDTLGKANPKTMFGKPNALLVLEGIATLQNTGNELSKTEAEKAANAILAAHSSMDVMDKDTQKRTTQLLADFKNIDPNVRHSIIMGDAVSKFTGNIALEEGTLHELLVETHRNILQNEIATGTLIPDEEIENFLVPAPSLTTVNAAAGSTAPVASSTSQKKTFALPPFGGRIAQLSRLEDPLREAVAEAQASVERSQAIVDDLIERKSTNTKSARASLAARLADLKEKENKLNSFLATKQSLLGKPGAA